MKRFLSISADAKTVKGESRGYLTGILYLAPSNLSGRNLCAFSSPGCIATCLNTAGRGQFAKTQAARMAKTWVFLADQKAFVDTLAADIRRLLRKANRERLTPAVRLNGTSDLPWENIRNAHGQTLFEIFPDVIFYDYTKHAARMRAYLAGKLPRNYALTFSRSECNDQHARDLASKGANVAVVFSTRKGSKLPTRWHGVRVLDGDATDLRFLDRHASTGYVIGLRAKGRAKRDTSGFVVNVNA